MIAIVNIFLFSNLANLREIGKIDVSKYSSLIIAEDNDVVLVSEYIKSNPYTGFSGKTICISIKNVDLFIEEVTRVLTGELSVTMMQWCNTSNKELIIQKVQKEEKDFKVQKYDLRQYVNTEEYKGYTKKGLRLTRKSLKSLLKFLSLVFAATRS